MKVTPEQLREWEREFEAAARRPLATRMRYAFSAPTSRSSTMRRTVPSRPWRTTGTGARSTCLAGSAMDRRFDYKQAEEIRDAFARHCVRYLFIGKSGAILLGFPDTTQDADVFVEKAEENGRAVVAALRELGFDLADSQSAEIQRGKDFVQLKSGPFDLDLVFAPDGIETFAAAWRRHVEVEGFPVCHLDDIIASKEATGRVKDRESLPRLRAFRDYWLEHNR